MENTGCCIPNPEIDTGSDQVQRCDICNENFSYGYCSDCEAHMCQTCFDRHLKTRPCRHHILSDNTNDQTLVTKTHSEPCKLHENQTIEFYCVDHSNVGCAKCMLLDHSTCNRENIEVAAKRYQDDGGIALLSKNIQELDNVYSECMQRVQLLTQSVAATNDKTVNDIESFKASVILNVDETVRVALEMAEHWRIDNENKIDKLSDDLKRIGNSIRLFKDNSERRDTFEKLFIVAMETEPVLGNFQERLSNLKNENVITEYKFHPHKILLDIITDSRLLGEVVCATQESGNGPPSASANVTLNEQSAINTANELSKGKKDKKGKKKLTKEDIGRPPDFRHVSHVGWDPNTGLDMKKLDPEMKSLFESIGFDCQSQDEIDKETIDFISDFVDKHGGLNAVREDLARRQLSDAPTHGSQGALSPAPARGAMPPPPSRSGGGRCPPPPPLRNSAAPPPPPPGCTEMRASPTMKPPPPLMGYAIPPPPGRRRGAVPPPPPAAKFIRAPPAPVDILSANLRDAKHEGKALQDVDPGQGSTSSSDARGGLFHQK